MHTIISLQRPTQTSFVISENVQLGDISDQMHTSYEAILLRHFREIYHYFTSEAYREV